MIFVLKTTMFIEEYWKTIKRDFLYKFFRSKMDLVIYILITQVVVYQKQKLQQICNERDSLIFMARQLEQILSNRKAKLD